MTAPGDAYSALPAPDRADSVSPADKTAAPERAARPVDKPVTEAAPARTPAARTAAAAPIGIARTGPTGPAPAANSAAQHRENTAAPAPPEPVSRARELLRVVGVGRALCWQIAALAAIAAIGEPRPVAAATVAVALGVIAATAVRFRGQWLYEWLVRSGKFLLRQRHRSLPLVATKVRNVQLDDVPVAFIHHRDGITAILEPHDGAALITSPATLLPTPEVDSPPLAAQLIVQMATNNSVSRRRTWITLQVLRTAELHRDADLSATLAGAVHRLVRRLSRDELPTRALDRDEALSLIAALSQPGDATDSLSCKETWDACEIGSHVQACFRIDKWQETAETTRQLILRRLQLVPSVGTVVAISARRKDRRGPAETDVVVRITEADRSRLDSSADLLAFALDGAAPVSRLNGSHLAAVAASLPFGAGPR